MSFIQKNLAPNERIIHLGKLHWWIYVKSLFFLILGTLLAFGSTTGSGVSAAGGFLMACAVIGLLITYVGQKSSEFALTNKRVMFKTGVFSRKMVELQLNKADGMQIEQSLLGRVFNFGKVRVTSTGVVENFYPVADPFGFKKQVNEAIEGSFANSRSAAQYS